MNRRITSQDLKDSHFLKYYRLVRKWACKANDIKDHTFLFSAASLSNLLIYDLYKEFDNNQYIDIGSALSPLLGLKGWRGTRVYLRCYWEGERNPIITQEDSWG